MRLATPQVPEPRLLSRLCRLIRHDRVGSGAFVVGGDALASVILSGAAPSEPALQLADAMIGELLLLQASTADSEDPDTRVRLAVATAMVSVLRPHIATQADVSVAVWLGYGIGSPRRMQDPLALFARAMLSLRADGIDDAVTCLDELFERFPRFEGGGALQDWLVARVQRHGADREVACLENFSFVLQHQPTLLVLAALVVAGATPRGEVIPWVESRLGSRSVAPVARRA